MADDRPEDGQGVLAQYRELAELAGALAHEIKNPLSVIRMHMDLMAEDLAEPQTQRERRAFGTVRVVHSQCERLEKLLNDFLKFIRLQRLDLTPGDLNGLVERLLNLYAHQARTQGVQIVPMLDPDLPAVLLDQEPMEAALVNLIKNALESMPDGGTLTVITRRVPQGVALDLIDTGCGIDDQTARRMFEAFYTTKQDGSGLGLPTARRIIEAHGGRISVQSQLNRGTKFTIELPALPRLASGTVAADQASSS